MKVRDLLKGYRWGEVYSVACEGEPEAPDDKEKVQRTSEFFDGDFSRKRVREYFLGPHNDEAYAGGHYHHMCFPYEVKEDGCCTELVVQDWFYKKYPKVPTNFKKKDLSLTDRIKMTKKKTFDLPLFVQGNVIYDHLVPVDVETNVDN